MEVIRLEGLLPPSAQKVSHGAQINRFIIDRIYVGIRQVKIQGRSLIDLLKHK